MAKGNSKAYLNSNMIDNTEIDYDSNKKIIELCIDVFDTKEPDLSNASEVKKTIDNYFNTCINRGLRPGNMGLYAVLGLERREALNLLQGRIKKNVSPESLAYIKKACKILSLFRESLGSEGKLNPATLIFWQKNFDSLEDVQRMEVAPVNALQADKTPDEIQKSLIDDIPIDAD